MDELSLKQIEILKAVVESQEWIGSLDVSVQTRFGIQSTQDALRYLVEIGCLKRKGGVGQAHKFKPTPLGIEKIGGEQSEAPQ